ncbi:MAG TPA: amino acid adenylation domain-containing protein, partial [Thermoanaerobaculia bacterium]|nr:amino acid adenylation domain-containing protein [Thermoanaerobaculia bacterium]
GKVDRQALSRLRFDASSEAPPQTPVEELLSALWCDILGIERVGREDSFFALGGHSLAATRLVARLAAVLGVEVPLRQVFASPTLAGLAKAIESRARDTSSPGLPLAFWKGRGGAVAPLSFAQERLWFVDRLRPGNTAFNMPAPFLLKGWLDPATLARAVFESRLRQGSLRTRFAEDGGRPLQVVDPPEALQGGGLGRVDVDRLPAPYRRAEAERIAIEDAVRPFDLARGPLFRPLLVRLAADEHLLLLTCHHIISDGWSSGILFRELVTCYEALTRGGPPLPEPPLQYTDFALWQREWLSGARLSEQLDFWRGQLVGISPLDLPADRPRRPVPTLLGGTRPFRLGAPATAALSELARGQGATLFMALEGGFAALLSLYTGETDVPIGTPVANRTHTELEGLIGFFINTLVLRNDLSRDPRLPEILRRSRETALGAFGHQDLPFEKLTDELDLPRDPYRPPLLRVLLQLQNLPAGALELPGLSLMPFELAVESAKFDLTVNLAEAEGEVVGELRYDADLFDGTTIGRLAEHFTRLLAAWVGEPDLALSGLSLLSPPERQQLILEWNELADGADGVAGVNQPRCLHALFSEQAASAPDSVAVTDGDRQLSYGELERRSGRLARYLTTRGLSEEERVALCLPRSVEMIVAILAVLKAGACYVPLDPAYPVERLRFMLEDSGASLLLTAGEEADLGEPAARITLRLDARQSMAEAVRHGSGEPPRAPAVPELPAYVIYTSGSTGQPKGVVVSHANVARLLTRTAPWFHFGAADTWTLFHSYAFDFSVWEIWGALLHGGRLVVVPFWESRSPEGFYRLLQREQATVLCQTPSAFRQLLWAEETLAPEMPSALALREVIFGGEALEPGSLAPWFARHGDRTPRLVNMYGITETTVHVTYRPLQAEDAGRGSLVGRPIPDLSLHVLGAGGRLQPIGAPGEMHVGGAGLAQGYLGRPDLTAERFLPDPWSPVPGGRLYRSGDLARRLPDGDLEYLGRIDHQVEIRGFRIELGEIEAALLSHPDVREAVVLARPAASGREARLIAYLVLEREMGDPAATLRAHLGTRLPEHMLPAAFLPLPELPLTTNGKVDRRALAKLAVERRGVPERARLLPSTELERFLAAQLRDVLGLDRADIGVEEDFFS